MEPVSDLKPGQFIPISFNRKKSLKQQKEDQIHKITSFYESIFENKKNDDWDECFDEMKAETDAYKKACKENYKLKDKLSEIPEENCMYYFNEEVQKGYWKSIQNSK